MLSSPLLANQARIDAENAHRNQRRLRSNEPYIRHPAEVAGIATGAYAVSHSEEISLNEFLAVCWLHDVIEDNHLTEDDLRWRYPKTVLDGVMWLTERREGTRAFRKSEHNERIALAPNWVKTIRAADMIANLRGLVAQCGAKDISFVRLYLMEKRKLLKYLTGADPSILQSAQAVVEIEEAFLAALG